MSARVTANAAGTLEDRGWEESTYSEAENGPKLTEVSLRSAYSGDLIAEGMVRYIMYYDAGDAGTGLFLGLEQVTGRLGNRTGSFVLKHVGTFEGGGTLITNTISVVPESGTGELVGLTGDGTIIAKAGETIPYTLDYEVG